MLGAFAARKQSLSLHSLFFSPYLTLFPPLFLSRTFCCSLSSLSLSQFSLSLSHSLSLSLTLSLSLSLTLTLSHTHSLSLSSLSQFFLTVLSIYGQGPGPVNRYLTRTSLVKYRD